ncbi:M23 family metallopeptidase [Agromyces lapidis]|uniref:M23 family metallopeptidase n=1 Tax=Agromyces lapidis TaxID=279574 RepID=A0ABV5SUE5_9MICO|nr:M23 family metallopeptidase [Agromyces lapidis]
MLFAGGMAVATSVPAIAITTSHTDTSATSQTAAIVGDPQSLEVAADAAVSTITPGTYVVESAPPPPPPPAPIAVAELEAEPVFNGPVVAWPVLYPDRISSSFGPRTAPCAGCSTDHDGVDFNSGDGTPVMAVAAGTVISSTDAGGGYGVMIEIEHQVDGSTVTSLYAHMSYGSRLVEVGDTVSAGEQIGSIGSTGQSTGAHLHLEMYGTDGVRFDGYAWLAARVG